MDFHFYTPAKAAFEPWDFRNPDTRGIGGSETSQIEMARRLAARGHRVVNYAPVPADCPPEDQGVAWRHSDAANFQKSGIWVLYRCPAVLENFTVRDDQQTWLICQDEDYPDQWTPERQETLTRCVALCRAHKAAFEAKYPGLRGKVHVSSNGLKPELVGEVLAEGLKRHPKRILYASSPDRALVPLLKIFERAREFDQELELRVAYGWDNVDKVVATVAGLPPGKFTRGHKKWLEWVENIKRRLQGPGITWLGRLSQPALYREWAQTGLWVYPNSRFRETSCITCMEAQALGAVPIFSPLWAVEENVGFGAAVEGDAYEDPLSIACFTAELVQWANDLPMQDEVRGQMQPWALETFSWERFVDQWEAWAMEEVSCRSETSSTSSTPELAAAF